MRILLLVSTLASGIWFVLYFGFPQQPVRAINNSTYSVEFGALALLAVAASIFAALKRMR